MKARQQPHPQAELAQEIHLGMLHGQRDCCVRLAVLWIKCASSSGACLAPLQLKAYGDQSGLSTAIPPIGQQQHCFPYSWTPVD